MRLSKALKSLAGFRLRDYVVNSVERDLNPSHFSCTLTRTF